MEDTSYRCPECDTYSGTFTPQEGGEMLHSICGRVGSVASFVRGTPEYERAYEGDEDEGWEVDLTPTAQVDNERRWQSVVPAIRAFIEEYHLQGESQETILTDLVTNLAHWADTAGLVWDDIVDRANRHHSAEAEAADLERIRRLSEGQP